MSRWTMAGEMADEPTVGSALRAAMALDLALDLIRIAALGAFTYLARDVQEGTRATIASTRTSSYVAGLGVRRGPATCTT